MGVLPVVLALPLFANELDLLFFLSVFAIVAGLFLSPSSLSVAAVSSDSSLLLVVPLSLASSVI